MKSENQKNRLVLVAVGYITIFIVAFLVFCPIKSTAHLLVKIPSAFHHVQDAKIIVYTVEFLNYGGISKTLEPLTLWQEYFEVGFSD